MPQLPRRSFLKFTGLAAGAALAPRSWAQVAGANGDVRCAFVGLNGRGNTLLNNDFASVPGARVTALCDADSAVLARVAGRLRNQGREVQTFADYRDLLAKGDVDAVILATPNHLHALQAIWAMQAGKDVYVEKPVSHNLWEGRRLIEFADKTGRVCATGSQCRSSTGLAEAVAWVKAGNLGKIKSVRGLCYKQRLSLGQTTGPQAIPETVNYDLWSGPVALNPPRRAKFHYDWHWFWDYGNGDLGNQGVHQMDIGRWFLGEPALAPRIVSVGGRLGYVDDGQTPNSLVVLNDYPSAPLIFEVRGLPRASGVTQMDTLRGASIGVIVDCEGGSVVVPSYTTAQAYDAEGKELKRFAGSSSHAGNFIAAVRDRKPASLAAPVLEGHISAGLCHTGNISLQVGKGCAPDAIREQIKASAALSESYARLEEHLKANGVDFAQTPVTLGVALTLDPKTEKFADNAAANALLTREYRKPYEIPSLA